MGGLWHCFPVTGRRTIDEKGDDAVDTSLACLWSRTRDPITLGWS